MVAGPACFICNRCIVDAAASIATGKADQLSPDQLPTAESLVKRCSFCGEGVGEVKRLVCRGSARICEACVCLCLDIVSDHAPKHANAFSFEGTASNNALEKGGMVARSTEALDALTHTGVSRCHFCDATREAVRQLLRGPGVVICDRCAADAAAAVVTWEPAQRSPDQPDGLQSELTHCRFCGKGVGEVKRLVYRGSACICDECVRRCLTIFGGHDPDHRLS